MTTPPTWRSSTWGDEVSLEYGKALRDYSESGGSVRVFGTNGPVGWTDTPLAEGPGVILGRKGAYRGVHYSVDAFWVIDTAYFVVPKADCDMRWLYYAITHHKLGEINDGSPIPSTTRAAVYPRELAVPPIETQRAIAAVLGSLDDKIEQNRRTARALERLARAIFRAWFVDFEPVKAKAAGAASFPSMPQPVFDALPTTFTDSEMGPVPEEWRLGTLGELGTLAIGGDWGKDEPFDGAVQAYCLRGVDLEHLRSTGQATPPLRWMKPTSIDRRTMNERDVLVAGSGAGPTGRPLWACPGFMRTDTPVIYSNFCKRIRCSSAAAAVYLDAWLHQMRESGEIWEHVNGTSVPNLDAKSMLAGKTVVIPPEPLLQTYYTLVRPMWEHLFCGENHTLAALRDYLLPQLLSGQVPVEVGDAERVATKGSA
ncbi:MAG: restriction endonuclease subunit S [Phycisphaeraceae bacterium]|nr:hypothetical protein [Phycisphaerales bacterium]QOJ18544.1 MAG: restriction endonuclease subunit S [Phycisphaeraceae bacterium]